MVAYSYKKRFVNPIRVGLGIVPVTPKIIDDPDAPMGYRIGPEIRPKRQTIRADRKRHARVGEEIQHYCGMRTKHCFLIGRARCVSVLPVVLHFIAWGSAIVGSGKVAENCYYDERLHLFAQADGFDRWEDMKAFWREEHPGVDKFEGVLIRWEP